MEKNFENEEILEQIKTMSNKVIGLSQICEALGISTYEALGYINDLKNQGINISVKKFDDDFRVFNRGEKSLDEDNSYHFKTNEDNEFKFVAISDTRFGSKSQQLSILNDIYKKAKENGYNKVILCGNITEGLYSMNNKYADTTFLDDTLRQADYITANYPKFKGIKTYFITGAKDAKHYSSNKIDIGKRISDNRDDMIYLGDTSCNIKIDNTNMLIFNPRLAKTYTASYRAQQQIDSFRSEDKPDILLYGGLLQMEKFSYRNVECISVPSVCATTKEMNDKRYSNTVGAWYITVKTNSKGEFESIKAIDSVYYNTAKEDYLHINRNNNKKVKNNDDYVKEANKLYRQMKTGMLVEEFMEKFDCSKRELNGMIEFCNTFGKKVNIVKSEEGNLVFQKEIHRKISLNKPPMELSKLNNTKLCVVSDTHFGSIHQQLHLLNRVYQEAYDRGIDTVLHCGDIVDGNYPNRPENPRQQFLHGFDEQAAYVVDMYPYVEGMNTYYILGSHDETHYKNGQATINEWVSRCRPDMIYLGQDVGNIDINKVKFVMDHPGGGSAQALSYKLQKRIEGLESNFKPNIYLAGHYHKGYFFVYRNVHGILIPALCDKTQFQQKQGLANYVGACFLDIWSDKRGNIQYFEPEQILFNKNDMWDEAGKDKNKVKQLIITG